MSNQTYPKSAELLDKAMGLVPAQTQTFSKGWTQYPKGVSPVFATRADGGYVWDADGNKFIDWPMALGPLLLGHNNATVNDAVAKQLDNGIAFSLPTVGELALAERLVDWFPYADRVRFGKNGSDATSGAVRAARAFTGRSTILCCGYHGWQDWFIGTTTRNGGVPSAMAELTKPFPYNDIEALGELLAAHQGDVAAVIMEPMGLVEPGPGYLEAVRQLATQHGAVLIFDECWTGFRIHAQGAFGKFGVAPDMACFGKALGNGVPISVVIGTAEVMETFEEIFFSFTFGGDMLGIAAAGAVLDVLESQPVLAEVDALGRSLMDGTADLVADHDLGDHIALSGYGARHFLVFSGDDADGMILKTLFQQEAMKAGILAAGWHASSWAHTDDDVQHTLRAYDGVFGDLARWIGAGTLSENIHGERVQSVFRKP
ncbi:MAG: aminotransferase class III-fold pyridoxal phosphate-dependent enzyme [Alphaproteobacteria bacterium]|nr:aminotransferase class III-fold pyridoxal phosphate-dependent enzyme [Alphaproteobacteria bacterium]